MNKYEIVRKLCNQRGISIRKLEKDLGFSNGYISKWKTSEPNVKSVIKVAGYFNVSPYIFADTEHGSDEEIRKHKEFAEEIYRAMSPYAVGAMLYRVSAGDGAYNDTYSNETLDSEVGNEFFTAEIVGDCMSPILYEGDVVIIQPQTETSPKDLSLVKVDGEHASIKYVEVVENGLWLRAENKNVFEDKFYSVQEIINLPIKVVGKVIELRRKIK